MQLFSFGEHTIDEEDWREFAPDADWIVYTYESPPWSGNGFGVICEDNKLYYVNLGHCSCYGPLDEHWSTGGQAEKSFLCLTSEFCDLDRSIHDDELTPEMVYKITELIRNS